MLLMCLYLPCTLLDFRRPDLGVSLPVSVVCDMFRCDGATVAEQIGMQAGQAVREESLHHDVRRTGEPSLGTRGTMQHTHDAFHIPTSRPIPPHKLHHISTPHA